MNLKTQNSAIKLNEPNENGITWDALSDKEKLVLLALLVSNSDVEAMRRSPIKKTQFYEYKKRIEPMKKKLITELARKSNRNATRKHH